MTSDLKNISFLYTIDTPGIETPNERLQTDVDILKMNRRLQRTVTHIEEDCNHMRCKKNYVEFCGQNIENDVVK